ncbi:MAG: hypothetical protein ACI4SY_01360, partial [Sutterella sp.]
AFAYNFAADAVSSLDYHCERCVFAKRSKARGTPMLEQNPAFTFFCKVSTIAENCGRDSGISAQNAGFIPLEHRILPPSRNASACI